MLCSDSTPDAVVPAMAIGVAVGMRSPLDAIFLIPELPGDYALVLPLAAVVGVAWLRDRALDRFMLRIGAVIPSDIYDEDAWVIRARAVAVRIDGGFQVKMIWPPAASS